MLSGVSSAYIIYQAHDLFSCLEFIASNISCQGVILDNREKGCYKKIAYQVIVLPCNDISNFSPETEEG
jgi:hypothetical protein